MTDYESEIITRYVRKDVFANSSRQEKKGKGAGYCVQYFACYLIFNNEPVNQVLGERKMPWFIAFVNFYGLSVPTMTNIKLSTWYHSIQNLKEMHTFVSHEQ